MEKHKVTNPDLCIDVTRCNHRHLCDALGGVYFAGQRVADCQKYKSRQDAYEEKVFEDSSNREKVKR